MLDEQVFNLEIRKLLKRFGVAAQREVEKVCDPGSSPETVARREAYRVNHPGHRRMRRD